MKVFYGLSLGALCCVACVLALVNLAQSEEPGDQISTEGNTGDETAEFEPNFEVLKEAGVQPDGSHKVLFLELQETDADTLLGSWFKIRAIGTPCYVYDKDRRHLSIFPRFGRGVVEKGVTDGGRIREGIRLMITHTINFTKGARAPYIDRQAVYNVPGLPVELDLKKRSGGEGVGRLGDMEKLGAIRLLAGELSLLGVRPDGAVKLRYDDQEFVLATEEVWPAAIRSRTVSQNDFLDATDAPVELRDVLFGNKAGVRFWTTLDILNRGFVTVEAATRTK